MELHDDFTKTRPYQTCFLNAVEKPEMDLVLKAKLICLIIFVDLIFISVCYFCIKVLLFFVKNR